jgi:hypothetical protein
VDATRQRRINGLARQQWYARWRLVRFARHLGFLAKTETLTICSLRFRKKVV